MRLASLQLLRTLAAAPAVAIQLADAAPTAALLALLRLTAGLHGDGSQDGGGDGSGCDSKGGGGGGGGLTANRVEQSEAVRLSLDTLLLPYTFTYPLPCLPATSQLDTH